MIVLGHPSPWCTPALWQPLAGVTPYLAFRNPPKGLFWQCIQEDTLARRVDRADAGGWACENRPFAVSGPLCSDATATAIATELLRDA